MKNPGKFGRLADDGSLTRYRRITWRGLENWRKRSLELGLVGIIMARFGDGSFVVSLPKNWRLAEHVQPPGKWSFGAAPPTGPTRLMHALDEQGRKRAWLLESETAEELNLVDARALTYLSVTWGAAEHGCSVIVKNAKGDLLYEVNLTGAMSEEEAFKLAEAWLDEHYSSWRDPSTYWE